MVIFSSKHSLFFCLEWFIRFLLRSDQGENGSFNNQTLQLDYLKKLAATSLLGSHETNKSSMEKL